MIRMYALRGVRKTLLSPDAHNLDAHDDPRNVAGWDDPFGDYRGHFGDRRKKSLLAWRLC